MPSGCKLVLLQTCFRVSYGELPRLRRKHHEIQTCTSTVAYVYTHNQHPMPRCSHIDGVKVASLRDFPQLVAGVASELEDGEILAA